MVGANRLEAPIPVVTFGKIFLVNTFEVGRLFSLKGVDFTGTFTLQTRPATTK